eukprot:7486710-Pyramimonas_sp.AAC.1
MATPPLAPPTTVAEAGDRADIHHRRRHQALACPIFSRNQPMLLAEHNVSVTTNEERAHGAQRIGID